MSLVVPAHLREKQHAASDPKASIWVSANAGSGKTHVLTQRVIRLLLQGVAPAKILCLTFTKAAAAQMATRVFETLSGWVLLDDGKLREAIRETGAPSPSPKNLDHARRLFTRAVETPGGLKIQTIHAFCERLLHLFPFEANVPARFEVADDRTTQEMLALAKQATIVKARTSSEDLKAKLDQVVEIAGSARIHAIVGDAMRLRLAARRRGDLQAELPRRLGADGLGSVAAVHRAIIEDGIPHSEWPAVAAVFETSSPNDQRQAERLRKAVALIAESGHADIAAAVRLYFAVFFGDKGEPRGRLMVQKLADAQPMLKARLEREQGRLVQLRAKLKIAEACERTDALVALADDIIEAYEHTKRLKGLLDFDDLIERTLTLLERSDAGWVLHKLDAGIDHVLVDEAQDTSEAQWAILEHLTDDFASGETSRPQSRSFFVVGDEKQSIFSFQGAAPKMFDDMRLQFQGRFREGGKPFERVPLTTSFRSVPGILDAVDRVFRFGTNYDGLARQFDAWPLHESLKATRPGLVEIWPRLQATEADDPEDWTIPVDTLGKEEPPSIIADRVARKIKQLTAHDSGEYVHDTRTGRRRPITPGDILVLVRTRGPFFDAVIRAMKHHWVKVAGADRLDVAQHIAVMDLCAAGRAALLPQDDLSLACVLKSPLLGLTDDDLIVLAPERHGKPLFDRLGASPVATHEAAHRKISAWSRQAREMTPFAFYVELLGRGGGRVLMQKRLGPEAHDAIDEFLRLALAHEQQGAPSLGSFLDDVEALESSIKRDMEGPSDTVRVMTVHAAKGLEAKIVFLPDTCAVPPPIHDPVVFDLNKNERNAAPLIVWSPKKDADTKVVADAREKAREATMQEYRRLLYVALTRAEERLYIAGFFNVRAPDDDSWSRMIEQTFDGADDVENVPAFWDENETVRRITTKGHTEPLDMPVREQLRSALVPAWLTTPVAPPPLMDEPLRPSKVAPDPELTAGRRDAFAYGSAMHLLLQHLPPIPAAERAAAARRFLAQRPQLVAARKHEELIAEALSVIAHPDLADLFGPDARAEIPVAGSVTDAEGRPRDLTGTVDRLVVTGAGVLVADFKTGAPEAAVPDKYRLQLDLYRRALAPLWPDRPLRTLLVWTRGPRVVEVAAAA